MTNRQAAETGPLASRTAVVQPASLEPRKRRRPSPFVVDAAGEFLRTKLAREPKTYAAYSGILVGSERGTKKPLGQPLAVYFHNRRCDSLKHDEIASWFAQRVRDGAPATKHRISKNARAFFRFACERHYVSDDLASAIEQFRPGGPRVEWLPWDDVNALIDAIPEDRYRMAAAWLFLTGCRVSEALRARQSHVRWIDEASLYQWSIPDTKTDRPRLVWLPERLNTFIESSRRQNGSKPGWPLLWDCRGRGFARVEDPSQPTSEKTINGALERARERAGLHVQVTAHVAKHSYCTNWIHDQSDEISLELLSRQVGTSVEVLRKTYIHVDARASDWAYLRAMGQR
jgi:integrase